MLSNASHLAKGDWNGDGRDDLAVSRLGVEGQWLWQLMLRGDTVSDAERISSFVWGGVNQRPMVADVNGDGRHDFGLVQRAIKPTPELDMSEFSIEFDTDGDRVADLQRTVLWSGHKGLKLEEAEFLTGDFDADGLDEIVVTRKPLEHRGSSRAWTINYGNRRIGSLGSNSRPQSLEIGTAMVERI
jgi:FG-GAP-like repeat